MCDIHLAAFWLKLHGGDDLVTTKLLDKRCAACEYNYQKKVAIASYRDDCDHAFKIKDNS